MAKAKRPAVVAKLTKKGMSKATAQKFANNVKKRK